MAHRPLLERLEERVLFDGTVVARLHGGQTLVENGATLMRLKVDGTPDSTFGSNGTATIPGENAQLGPVQLQADGKIVVGGYVQHYLDLVTGRNATDLLLARLNPDGSLDRGFGNNGLVTEDVAGRDDKAAALALAADGKIVVAGWDFNFLGDPGMANARPFLLRFLPDGTADATFADGGKVLVAVPGSWYAETHAVSIQPNGDIVLSTSSIDVGDESGTSSHPVVFTFDSQGDQKSVASGSSGAGGGRSAAADVVVKSFRMSHPLKALVPGAREAAALRVENLGNTLALGPKDFVVYAANPRDPENLAGATQVGRFTADVRVKPGASRTVRGSFTVSAVPPAGQYVLVAAVAGSSFSGRGPAVTVAVPGQDLAIDFARPAPLTLTRGGRGAITLTLSNIGSEPVRGPVDLTILASPDGTAGPAAQTVVTFQGLRFRLPPGGHKRLRLAFTVAPSLTTGSDFLLATVSTPFVDSNPANNTAASPTGTVIVA